MQIFLLLSNFLIASAGSGSTSDPVACELPAPVPGFRYANAEISGCTSASCRQLELYGVSCASGFIGTPTIVSKCSVANPVVTLTGCAAECSLTAPPAGFNFAGAAKIEGCTWEECDNFTLLGVSCANGYTGVPTIVSKCTKENLDVQLTGCDATCMIPVQPPAGFEYNQMNFEGCTPFECDNFAMSGVDCAVGYVGVPTIQSKCSLSDPLVTLTGCDAECSLPAPPAGYEYAGAAKIENCTAEECENFTLSGVTCSNGYVGTPSIREQCTDDNLDIELTGCEIKCFLPTDQPGYDIDASSVIENCTPSQCTNYKLDVKCAIGYDGEVVIESRCSVDQPEIVLAGCQLKHGCSVEAVDQLTELKNPGYLFKGYDILKGNPLPFIASEDPGFTLDIFAEAYTHGLVNSACQYRVPNGASFIDSQQSCSLSSTSSTIYGEASLTRELQNRVDLGGVEIEAFQSKFSGSFSYQKVKTDLDTNEVVMVVTGAQCGAYTLTNNPGDIAGAEFSPGFATEVFGLPLNYSVQAYADFVSKYGTHYVNKITLGSAYYRHNKISKETFVRTTNSGRDIGVIARAAADLWTAQANSSHTRELEEEFRNTVIEYHETTLGANRLQEGGFQTWSSEVSQAPMPLKVDLTLIDDLLDHVSHLKNYQHYYATETAENLSVKKANLRRFLTEYCGHLLEKDGVPTCDAPKRGRSPYSKNLQIVNTPWTTGVTTGRPILHTCRDYASGNRIKKIRARQQTNYGLVDLEVTCDNGNIDRFTHNDNGWFGSGKWNKEFTTTVEGFDGVQVMRQRRYGVTNYRMSTDGSYDEWSNSNTVSVTSRKGECPEGTQVVGMEIREQDGYGIVNWRLQCYDTGMKCASEGGDCHCSLDDVNPGEIRFGANGKYTDWLLVEGTVKCKSDDLDPTNSLDLGNDVEKHCFCRTPRLQDQWDEPEQCATQGNECRCDNGQVRYGAQGFWSAWEPVESSVSCTDNHFSDVAWGYEKICQCRKQKAFGRRTLSQDIDDISSVSRLLREVGNF